MSNGKEPTFISDKITKENDDELKEIPQENSKSMFQRKIEPPTIEPLGDIFEDPGDEEEEEDTNEPAMDPDILNESQEPPEDRALDATSESREPTSPLSKRISTISGVRESTEARQEENIKKENERKRQKQKETQKPDQIFERETEDAPIPPPLETDSSETANKPRRSHGMTPTRAKSGLTPKTQPKSQTPKPALPREVEKKPTGNEAPKQKPSPRPSPRPKKHNSVLFWIIILTFVFVLFLSQRRGPRTEFQKLESQIVTKLNDCIYPCMNVSIEGIDFDFVNAVIDGRSEFLDVVGNYLVVKKPHKTCLCKAIEFGDRHPDLAGMILVWIFALCFYLFSVYHSTKARKLLPSVLDIIRRSKGKVCFVDDVKAEMQRRGVSRFTWGQIVHQLNKDRAVKTVHVEYSKPLWSLQD